MFNIKIGKEYLSLAKGSKISLEFNSSLFDNELFRGSYSYPIDFDLSPRNIRLTDFRNIVQSKTRLETPIPISLDVLNNPYRKGTLKLDFSNQEKMSGYVLLDSGLLADTLDTVKINTIDYGGNIFIGNTYAAKLAHFNAKAPLDPIVNDYVFFPILNPNFFGQDSDSVNPEFTEDIKQINYYGFNTFQSNEDNPVLGTQVKYSFVPFPSLVFVIKKICEYLGYKATGDWLNDTEIKTAVIYNTVAIDKYVNRPAVGFDPAYVVNAHQDYINIQNHIPALTIGEFLLAVRNFFFVNIDIDSTFKTIEFKKFKTIFNDSNYLDLSKNASKGYEHKPFSTNGIEWNWNYDSNDEMFEKMNYNPISVSGPPTGEKDAFNCNANTLFMLRQNVGGAWIDRLLPEALQRGNSLEPILNDPEYNDSVLGSNDYQLRFLFYRGRHFGSNFWRYPLGSSDVWNWQNEKVGETSLDFFGEFGRRNMYAREYINFRLNTKPLTFTKLFSYKELLEIKSTRKVIINGIKGFVYKFNIDSDFKTKPGKIQIYTVW